MPTPSPTPSPTPWPTPNPLLWSQLGGSDSVCTGKVFNIVEDTSREACQELAVSRLHSFYQHNEYKQRCVTVVECDAPIVKGGWNVYRQDDLWPQLETFGDTIGFKCTSKKKAKAEARSPIECQQAAELRGHTYFQYLQGPARRSPKCATAKKCKNRIPAA